MKQMEITYEVERQCRDLIQRTCSAMDKLDFETYLAACHEDYDYAIRAYSPEIRRDMTWLGKNLSSMKTLLDMIPKQNRDRTPLTRHFSIVSIERDTETGDVLVRSALQVYRNTLDGGEVSVYAVGAYIDRIVLTDDGARLKEREVRLETRSLGNGSHVPF